MAINHLESIKMRVYVLLLTCLFFSLLGKPQQPRMMYEDTSRRGVPFSKDPHVVNFQGRYLMYYTLPPNAYVLTSMVLSHTFVLNLKLERLVSVQF